MELHQVRYFLSLARTLNFTRAAEQCNVTQPALTKAIQKLESELGGDLVFRERQLTQLTDLGRLVLPTFERVLAAARAASAQAKDFHEKEVAVLRIGLAPTISASILVEPIAELARLIRGLEIDIVDLAIKDMSAALVDGDIHAGIASWQEPIGERIDHWTLFNERYVALMASTHRLANLPIIPLSEIRMTTWLERVGCDVGEQFRQSCFQLEGGPKIGHRGHQENHLQHMAAAGLGLMLAPSHAPHLSSLVARAIEGDPIHRDVALFVMAGRRYTPALEAFIKVARARDWCGGRDNAPAHRPSIHANVRKPLGRNALEEHPCFDTYKEFATL